MKKGILEDEEEIGEAWEGHAMRIGGHLGNRPDRAGNRVGQHAHCHAAPGGRTSLMGTQERQSNPGHDEQLRPGQHGAQPVRDRIDPGRLDQRDGQLPGNQEDAYYDRREQHPIGENIPKQGGARRRAVHRTGVHHTLTCLPYQR